MTRGDGKIVVMGLGYIGLPTAAMLAAKGHSVVGVDISKQVVDIINSGNIHIVEPDLDTYVKSAVNSGRLKASLVPEEADTYILAVPTPFKETKVNPKTPDITYVEAATRTITPFLKPYNLIILESTSPIGTSNKIYQTILNIRPELKDKIYVAHCPERVLPGQIIRELVNNSRIIGGINNESGEKASELYKTFCEGEILLTNCETAEMAKLVENSFRDVNIAFANELSIICEKIEVNVWEVIALANKHPRVNILNPGPGVGGHCIAVDPWFIVDAAPDEARLIRTAREVNDSKPHFVINKIVDNALKLEKPVIGCLGLAFKANIDDLRESPALEIVEELVRRNIGEVFVCEPNIMGNYKNIQNICVEKIIKKANIIVVLVDHKEFLGIDKKLIKDKVIIDMRGIWK